MSLRTRMAFVVVLILLGCVFAAPYYRTQVAKQGDNDDGSSLPTLQIQRPKPAAPTLEVTDIEANTISPLKSEVAATRSRFSTQPELAPIPALEMPPAFVSARSQTAPAPEPQSFLGDKNERKPQPTLPAADPDTQGGVRDLSKVRMRPVSLNSNDTGTKAAWPQTERARTTSTGTLRPVAHPARESAQQPSDMQRVDNRYFASEQFRSFQNGPQATGRFRDTMPANRPEQTAPHRRSGSRRVTTSSRFAAPANPRGRDTFQRQGGLSLIHI